MIPPTPGPSAPAPATPARHVVLRISGMPRAFRPAVEEALVQCLPTPASRAAPVADVHRVAWFTAWRADPSRPRAVRCEELLDAPAPELAALRAELALLAEAGGFHAELAPHRGPLDAGVAADQLSAKGSSQQSTRSPMPSTMRVGR